MRPIRLLLAPVCLALACSSTSAPPPPETGSGEQGFTVASGAAPRQILRTLHSSGHMASMGARAASALPRARDARVYRAIQERVERGKALIVGARKVTSLAPPSPPSSGRSKANRSPFSFVGTGTADVDRAFGSPLGVTPPDQGLCVGNGFVLEAVNEATQVFDTSGTPLGAPVYLGDFFDFPPDTSSRIHFPSDPKCYFDHATGRFFATVLRIENDANTFQILGSFLNVVVSETGDPRGAWHSFSVDMTNTGANGSPSHAHCPCLGDQPLLGADTHGFYVSTNEFGFDPASRGFNGGQIYAFSKRALVAGTLGHVIQLENLTVAGSIARSIQPATTPTGRGANDANGSEYFLSHLDFDATLDNRIALWSLSNTASLGSAAPHLTLESVVLESETYGVPPTSAQGKPGPTPLRDCLAAGTCPPEDGFVTDRFDNTLEELETDDDRMNQAVFAGGRIWSALHTIVQMASGPRVGVAYFAVEPRRLASGRLGGRIASQGYVALDDADLLYPSIALTDEGRGAIAFSLNGPNDYPSAAYVRLRGTRSVPGRVHVARPGVGPIDDFSGYMQFPGDDTQFPARFGDYSAALVDGTTLWMATEAVTAACATLACPGRNDFTNWGTVVSRIDLGDDTDD